ncbi:hypothetical protein a10_00049 [Streptomyces acidiscabies]|nr:hypothetical protein a10_00049 [Streptomyces acidiscabies]GAV37176.1 hypothetical protein Saa2_00049 [Streptomyces acidiscabies]
MTALASATQALCTHSCRSVTFASVENPRLCHEVGSAAWRGAWRQVLSLAADPTSWLSGYRRPSPHYERNPRNYLAFLGLAAALCCHKRLIRLTT